MKNISDPAVIRAWSKVLAAYVDYQRTVTAAFTREMNTDRCPHCGVSLEIPSDKINLRGGTKKS